MTKSMVRMFVVCGMALVLGLTGTWRVDGGEPASDGEKIAALVLDLETMGPAGLQRLEPVEIRPWQLPTAGVDVMRAQLEETYAIDGVGEDTVQLTGWIAVRHSNPRLAEGETDLTWNTAVLDTEFVGLELHGTSELFGPIEIRLASERPSRGQVGRIGIPDLARTRLLAQLGKGELPGTAVKASNETGDKAAEKTAQSGQKPPGSSKPAKREPAPTFKVDGTRTIRKDVRTIQPLGTQQLTPEDKEILDAVACEAPLEVAIYLPDLGLEMRTEKAAVWYSLVDTIPPVGHTASVTIEPVRLIADGRPVGTLISGWVKFREVVRHVPLSSDRDHLATIKP